jgi:hypothetical protein
MSDDATPPETVVDAAPDAGADAEASNVPAVVSGADHPVKASNLPAGVLASLFPDLSTPPAVPASKDVHSAAPSILGYAYQIRSGLLELLRAKNTRPDMLLSIEMHDDIAWEDSKGEVAALLQYKLHQNVEGHLSDYSDDLWRTLKVWLDRPQPADPQGPELWMVTTAVAKHGSIAATLRAGETRNEVAALEALEHVAKKSKDKETRKSRDAFMKLTAAERSTFVSRIYIADASGDLAAVEDEVANELRAAAPYDHVEAYLEMVWGWWNHESLRHLQDLRGPIGVQEMLKALTRIRDGFTDNRLPDLVPRTAIDLPKVMTAHAERLYVHQLRRVEVPDRTLAKAVMDYERAYLQADKWVGYNLVDFAKLEAFSEDLLDEWERAWDFMCDELPAGANDDDKKRAGRKLLRTLEDSAAAIEGFDDAFFARGQRHALADDRRLGWHPDFQAHLEEFLLGA